MPTYQVTTKTKEEIDAEFELAFKGIAPSLKSAAVTQEQRLEPYREAVLTQRERGLTWDQIAETMSGPIINEKVSSRSLARVFGGKGKKARKVTRKRTTKPKAKPAAKPATPKPPKEHLILDPITGQRITPNRAPTPAPQPAPVVEEESAFPANLQSIFDRAVPKIIRNGIVDEMAADELGHAAGEVLGGNFERINAFMKTGLEELDRLDWPTAAAKYRVKREDWDRWRKSWDLGRDQS